MSTSHRKPAQDVVDHSRRRLVAGSLAAIGGTVLLGATATPAAAAAQRVPGKRGGYVLRNAGAGIHSGPDTAFGASTFTLNPLSITCGVGSIANSPGAVPGTAAVPTGAATSGPFIMMMFAQTVTSYRVDKATRTITAKGAMRSITNAGTQLIEDVEHPYVAVGIDHRNARPDEFFLHFLTPFWTPASNPMATKSTLREDWSMFGSAILMGEINVD